MKIQGLQKLTLLDYPGRIACTVFLGGCNFRCPFCHNGGLALGGDSDGIMSVEELLAFLDSRRGRLQAVCISGGEPTLHPDLPALIGEIKSRGFEVKLDTNGTNPEMLSLLIADGLVDYVAMDIKNSLEKYEMTAGVNVKSGVQNAECRVNAEFKIQNAELINKVKCSAELLMKGAVDFEFRTTLVKELHTADDLEAIGKWLSGGEKYFLQTYRDEGDLLVGGFTAFSPEETGELLAVLRAYIPSAEIR
jgi:pyruvate formate lyase activating enzyme